jgi:hypothetical protein
MPISSYISSERITYLLGVFVLLFTLLFNLSFIDLLFWHTDLECKNLISKNISVSLNTWLQVSSTYGLIYAFLFFILFLVAIECKEQTSCVVNYEKSLKILFIISTGFIFVWNIVGIFMMGFFYQHQCNIVLFNNYMWFRLTLGTTISVILISIHLYKMTHSPTIRDWFYAVQTTYTPPSN